MGQDYRREVPLLRPLPGEPFETGITLTPRVDRHARITVRQCHYSVPARYVGRRVRVLLRATDLRVYDGARVIAEHERSSTRGSTTLVLDHYLEVLTRKPGALPGATALAQARASGTFTASHEAYWAAARARYGDTDGTKALVDVLLLHRHHRAEDVIAGIDAALSVGALTADVVAVETRRATDAGRDSARPLLAVVDPEGQLRYPPDTRPLPALSGYDELLTGRHR